jgi:DNA-binding transcriptional MerR regulator
MYTIKQAAARSGLSVPVLRAWERRYGVVTPMRTASGYRLYDEPAVMRLRTMRALIDRGWSPSSAAAALVDGTAPDVDIDAEPSPGGRLPVRAGTDVGGEEKAEALRSAFVGAAATLDAEGVERTLDEMLAGGSYEVVVERDILPALRALGDAWEAGRVDIAGEHAASQAVWRRLAAAFQAAGRAAPSKGAVLVGLPPGARHELGALAFAIAARRAGVPVLYLGPDLPVGDWVASAQRVRARAAVVGAVARTDGAAALEVARALIDAVPGILVAFGGSGAPNPTTRQWSGRPPVMLPDGMRDAVLTLAAGLGRAAD